MDGIDISRLHGVRPLPGLNERFWRRVEVLGECWIWRGGRNDYGYGLFSLPVTSDRGPAQRTEGAHRIVYEAVHGRIPRETEVLHSCDTPPCVRPAHLRAGTSADNAQDKVDRGRAARTPGAVAHRARIAATVVASLRGRTFNSLKMTDAQVRSLRESYAMDPTMTAARLAKRYGITKQSAIRIIRGRSRKSAGGPISAIRPSEGDRVPNAKLTDVRVLEMRRLYAQRGITMDELAGQFGVQASSVSQIIRGKRWTHVAGPLKRTRLLRRLTAVEVREAREALVHGGVTQRTLARRYGVSPATISHLARGKSHVR